LPAPVPPAVPDGALAEPPPGVAAVPPPVVAPPGTAVEEPAKAAALAPPATGAALPLATEAPPAAAVRLGPREGALTTSSACTTASAMNGAYSCNTDLRIRLPVDRSSRDPIGGPSLTDFAR